MPTYNGLDALINNSIFIFHKPKSSLVNGGTLIPAVVFGALMVSENFKLFKIQEIPIK
jgi:hypothetical protein